MEAFYRYDRARLGEGAKIPLIVVDTAQEAFASLAGEMLRLIAENNAAGKPSVLIVPVGPVGQYPLFVRAVNERRVSLRNTWFFNMDEYLTDDDRWIDPADPLSFRGFMAREVYGRIDPALVMPEEQRVFPDPRDPARLTRLLAEVGGAQLCVGGIGINGHVAFNEAAPEMTAEAFEAQVTRAADIRPETRAVNSVNELGGAMEAMPRRCVTIGMREILAARKIRLGCFRDWHRGPVRRAAYGERSAGCPASLLQGHPDASIVLCANVAEPAVR